MFIVLIKRDKNPNPAAEIIVANTPIVYNCREHILGKENTVEESMVRLSKEGKIIHSLVVGTK